MIKGRKEGRGEEGRKEGIKQRRMTILKGRYGMSVREKKNARNYGFVKEKKK